MINVTDRTFKINNTWLGFHMTFLLFCARISIPSMYQPCQSTITSRKQQKDTRHQALGTISRSSTSGIFRVLHNGGCANSSTDSANPLSSSLFILFLEDRLRTRIVYKFSCASCNACYISEASRHFSTRVDEHLSSDRSSHVYKHLQSSESVVLPPVAQTALTSQSLPHKGIRLSLRSLCTLSGKNLT